MRKGLLWHQRDKLFSRYNDDNQVYMMIIWEIMIRHIAQSLKELKVWFFQGPCTINNPSMIRRWQWKVGIEKSGATIEMIQTNEERLPRAAVVDPSTGKLKRKLKMELIFVINVPAEYAANQLMVNMMRKIITTIIIVTIIIMKISFTLDGRRGSSSWPKTTSTASRRTLQN